MIDIRTRLTPDASAGSRLDALYSNSAAAFESKFLDERFSPPLRVDFSVPGSLDAELFGKLTEALQESTARIARGLRFPSATTRARINRNDVERAPLMPLGSFGGSLLFSFPKPSRAEDSQTTLPFDIDYTLTEAAVRELVTVLPKSAEDHAAIEVLPSQAVAVRSAVQTLAQAISATGGVKFTLDLPKQKAHIESVVSGDQARGIKDVLSGFNDRVTEETVKATLDGVRTQRRLFYLIRENGPELHGSMGPELIPQIHKYLGQPVVARVQKIIQEDDAGRTRRAVYRLLSVSIDREIDGIDAV